MFHTMRVGLAVRRCDDGIRPAAPHRFRRGPSEGQFGPWIPSRDRAVGVHTYECVVGCLEDHAIALALFPEHFFTALQSRNIPGNPGDPGNPSAPVKYR